MDQNLDPRIASAVHSLSEKLKALKSEISTFENPEEQIGDNNLDAKNDLDQEVVRMKAEIEELTKNKLPGNTVPEPEDSSLNYFLTVSELTKSNEILRDQIRLTNKNIQEAKEEAQFAQQLIKDLSEINKGLCKSDGDGKTAPVESSGEGYEAEVQLLDEKILQTRKLYKEFKDFFGIFLKSTADDEDNVSIGQLIQALWDKLKDHKASGNATYLNISHLSFDVAVSDVSRLVGCGIVEIHPEDNDRIRMVDFTK